MKSPTEATADHMGVAILDHEKIAERVEAEEVRAGVVRGSWRYADLREWQRAIQDGLRRLHQTTRLAELAATLPTREAAES